MSITIESLLLDRQYLEIYNKKNPSSSAPPILEEIES